MSGARKIRCELIYEGSIPMALNGGLMTAPLSQAKEVNLQRDHDLVSSSSQDELMDVSDNQD